jgi:hypothetical protein
MYQALKDEVRRLSRGADGSSPTSSATSPTVSRSNSNVHIRMPSTDVSVAASGAGIESGRHSPLPEPDQEYLKAVFLKFLDSRDKRVSLLLMIIAISRLLT